jgi:hypothetical protein
MNKTRTVFLVKFDVGYYAAKQPHYHWSFTPDKLLAMPYTKRTAAVERAVDGIDLGNQWRETGYQYRPDGIAASSYEIEEYEITETWTKK